MLRRFQNRVAVPAAGASSAAAACTAISSSSLDRRCTSSTSGSGNTTMGSSFAQAGYSQSLKTPSFGDIGQMPAPPELGQIDSKAATNVDIARDLHGPWILLAAPSLEGELFVKKDGIVFFRPGNKLGYGIGKLKLTHTVTGSAVAEVELEAYLFDAVEKEPPLVPERYKFVVALSVASAPKENYCTFTMHGQAMRSGDCDDDGGGVVVGGSKPAKNLGAVNAAKLEPWDSSKFGQEWEPNPQLAEGFKVLFPRPFTLGRLEASLQNKTQSSSLAKPALDLSKFKVSGAVDSVFYVPDYLTAAEEEECLQQNKDTPPELKNKLDRRVVQEYGGTMCPECNKSFVSDANLPPWCGTICDCLVSDGVFTPTTFPNNVRIHDYEVGHGIAPHCDGPIYVPRVAILSLASPVLMSFYKRRGPHADVMQHYEDTFKFDGEIASEKPIFSLVLEPRSLLIFEKDAYHFHPHGISANETDSLEESVVGPIANRHLLTQVAADAKELVRKHRVGVTIRNLLPRCAHEPQRVEYQMLRAAKVARPDWFGNSSSFSNTAAVPEPKRHESSSSRYSAMSQSPPPPTSPMTSASSSSGGGAVLSLERKVDDLLQRQSKIESQLKEIQTLLAFGTQRNVKFESDVSGVLDHVSQLVLDVSARVEDIAAAQEEETEQKRK